jgi:hypothetical protein
MHILAASYESNGFPALLILLGILGLVVALGILIANRRALAGRVAAASAISIVLGIVIENVT